MKTIFIILILLVIFFIGCSTVPSFVSHGISNLRVVDETQKIYRGGQPDINGFKYLKSIGITNILKLNLEANEDIDAKNLGLNVVYVPIDMDDQLFSMPKEKFDKAVNAITPGTYIHCEHGQDRTGLVVGGYRKKSGWTKENAEKEMLADGFHKELFGLWRFWENLK
jgi:tyrosine-protein phosphatase SIW14